MQLGCGSMYDIVKLLFVILKPFQDFREIVGFFQLQLLTFTLKGAGLKVVITAPPVWKISPVMQSVFPAQSIRIQQCAHFADNFTLSHLTLETLKPFIEQIHGNIFDRSTPVSQLHASWLLALGPYDVQNFERFR